MIAGDIKVGDHVHPHGRVTRVVLSPKGQFVVVHFGADYLLVSVDTDLSAERDAPDEFQDDDWMDGALQ